MWWSRLKAGKRRQMTHNANESGVHGDTALAGAAVESLADSLAGRHVLVVEDNGLLCGMLDETLRGAGCHVVGPYSRLDQAMAAMPAIRVDMALLDISLRGELVCPLVSELTQRGVPFLLTSAYQSSELPRALQSAAFLRKPFTEGDLLEGLTVLMKQPVDDGSPGGI